MNIGKYRPSYASVVATLALFIALGGGAYALSLDKNSVKSKHIKRGQVKNSDLGADAVTEAKVKDGSLLATDFGAGQLPAGEQGPPGTDATNLYAAFSSAGALTYGEGALGVTRVNQGIYSVAFDRNLTNCVATASSGRGEPDQNGAAGGDTFATVNDLTGNSAIVWIMSSNGLTADRDGMVAVFCP